jgi:hypothetical protein
MKRAIGFLLLLCTTLPGIAQHTISIRVKDATTKEPLPGASILLKSASKGTAVDSTGQTTLYNLQTGPQTLEIHHIGCQSQTLNITVPIPGDTLTILLERAGEEMDQVVISSTRSNRTILNLPTPRRIYQRRRTRRKRQHAARRHSHDAQ